MAHKAKKHKQSRKPGKKAREEDLLPESREFLETQTEGKVIYKNIPMAESEEKYKRMIMWSGITFFMVLISLVWGYNLKNNFNLSVGGGADDRGWSDLSEELDKVMDTMKESTDKLNLLTVEELASSTATTTDETYNMASIAELKKELESASNAAATTTQPGVKK